jgi:predicted hydrolase (HD superfamily)
VEVIMQKKIYRVTTANMKRQVEKRLYAVDNLSELFKKLEIIEARRSGDIREVVTKINFVGESV